MTVRRIAAIAFALSGLVGDVQAEGEFSAVLRAIPETHELRSASPFALAAPLTDFGRDRARFDLEARARWKALAFVGTARSTLLEGREPRHEGFVNELYADTTIGGQSFSLGKKIAGWGVGFGFRPLDVVQQQDRRVLNLFTPEGIPAVAWERFTDTAAWTVLYANPTQGRAGESRDDESLALRAFRQAGPTDWHGVARWSTRHRVQVGAGANHVVSDSTQVYGSLLFMRRHDRGSNALAATGGTLSASDPMIFGVAGPAWQFAAGGSWTGESGIGVLVEAWYDGTAWRRDEWTALHALALRQAALLGAPGVPESAVRGNLAYGLSAFERPNLARENLLGRISYDGEFWDAALDVLLTPRDRGAVLTASVSRQYDKLRWELGLRRYAGPPGSAYGMLPERHVGYLATQLYF